MPTPRIQFSIMTPAAGGLDSVGPGLQQMLSALQGGGDGDLQQILARTVNQGQPGAAPASQAAIERLDRVQADRTNPPQCPVCFEDITGQATCACAPLRLRVAPPAYLS